MAGLTIHGNLSVGVRKQSNHDIFPPRLLYGLKQLVHVHVMYVCMQLFCLSSD